MLIWQQKESIHSWSYETHCLLVGLALFHDGCHSSALVELPFLWANPKRQYIETAFYKTELNCWTAKMTPLQYMYLYASNITIHCVSVVLVQDSLCKYHATPYQSFLAILVISMLQVFQPVHRNHLFTKTILIPVIYKIVINQLWKKSSTVNVWTWEFMKPWQREYSSSYETIYLVIEWHTVIKNIYLYNFYCHNTRCVLSNKKT